MSDLDSPNLETFLGEVGSAKAFEVLTALLPDAAIFAVDAKRNVVHWSDGAERVLGFRREEVLGRLCLAGIRCRNCMIGCGIAQYGTIDGYPLELFRGDGQIVRTRKYAKAFRDARGGFAGGIEVLIPTGVPLPQDTGASGLPEDAETFHGMLSRDPTLKRAFQTVRNVAETDAPVLLRGESGTGKELVAHAIHVESHRRGGPFIAVNCAALTPTLIESELFGHKRGAFTGAASDRKGLFAQADRGTLLLDEVAELPIDVQAKLLRVLEEKVVTPVGASETTAVDVRIVAATHRALRQEVKRGTFREDLLYRLRVVPIFLPPLRERQGDVDLLLRRFLDEFNQRGPRRVVRVAPDAMRAMLDHPWPGNVRELRNVVEYAFAVGRGAELELSELPPELRELEGRSEDENVATVAATAETEADRIQRALDRSGGKVSEAAASLGMSRPTFWRKRKLYGL
jgi:transcriptional regulator with PAS, ATPase and Fis domain